jgi:hypothetical protein
MEEQLAAPHPKCRLLPHHNTVLSLVYNSPECLRKPLLQTQAAPAPNTVTNSFSFSFSGADGVDAMAQFGNLMMMMNSFSRNACCQHHRVQVGHGAALHRPRAAPSLLDILELPVKLHVYLTSTAVHQTQQTWTRLTNTSSTHNGLKPDAVA